jgi:hypothetical protein
LIDRLKHCTHDVLHRWGLLRFQLRQQTIVLILNFSETRAQNRVQQIRLRFVVMIDDRDGDVRLGCDVADGDCLETVCPA